MKVCPSCKATYPDDANFCPQETCATENGPSRLAPVAAEPASRYHLLSRIGGRSTGEVWKARDNQTGAVVAYKVIAPEVVPSANVMSRIERELKQLMKVASPRVATVLDTGRTPDDRLYVVTELCDGESLDRTLKLGPLSMERAKAIVAQIGQALLEAQKAGLVHRDVAPKNVLVSTGGEVKVINFALARPINDKAAGVAAYLSPEQAQGKPVDQRSNTYSLASTLYHMLTGEPPFQAQTPEAILDLHISSPPLAPSQRRPEASLSSETDRVILKALDKSSSRRHLTLRLFLSEVDALTAAAAPSPGAAAGAPGAPGTGFARTMLFAGGQQEVASLVAKAIASRGGPSSPAATMVGGLGGPAPQPRAEAKVAPLVSPPAAQPVASVAPAVAAGSPADAGVGAHGIGPTTIGHMGHAATVAASSVSASANGAAALVAAAAAGPNQDEGLSRLTPPPATPFPPQVAVPAAEARPVAASSAAAAGKALDAKAASTPAATGQAPGAQGKGAAFRETLWFKKGDVETMIAEAKAKVGGPSAAPGAVVAPASPAAEDVRPIEDRYIDDGTVTTDDRKKFSLRTGGTATSLPVVAQRVPGEKMSAEDVIAEVSGSGRRTGLIVVIAVLVLGAVGAVVAFATNKKVDKRPVTPGSSVAPASTEPSAVAAPAPARVDSTKPALETPPAPPPAAATETTREEAPRAAVARDDMRLESGSEKKRKAKSAPVKRDRDKKKRRPPKS